MELLNSIVNLYIVLTWLLFIVQVCFGQEIIRLPYAIKEEEGQGVVVANTGKDSNLYNIYRDEFQLFMFQPLTEGNPSFAYFTVDVSNGVVRTAKNIDREEICPDRPQCSVKLNIAVYKRLPTGESQTLLNVIEVTIDISDINDNSPTFPRRVVNLPVPENLEVNHPLYTSVASDADAEGVNSKITYRLDPRSDVFELSTVKTNSGLEDLVITIKKVLDREEKSLYPLTVVATDLGNPSNSGSVLINIQVTDMNDNPPVFGRFNYSVNILENTDIGDPVVIVTASDRDEGENSRLTYSLSSQVPSEIKDLFTVEPQTGKVFSRRKLDYETKHIYQFYVTVSDNGSPPKSNFAHVTVNVIDVNDNAPVILVTKPPGGDTVVENGSVGKFLAHIKVTDADSGINGEVSCGIEDTHFILEVFDGDNYKIKLNRELDREESDKRNVVVICQDGDVRPLSASASFTLLIEDVNDNAPIFLVSSLQGSVMENGDDSAYAVKVVASDPDLGENSRVTYALTGGKGVSHFIINPNTGVISTTKMMDREDVAEYYLEVRASDHGAQTMVSSATVTITVIDKNDNPPKFTMQAFQNSIVENRPRGSPAGNISAYDPDTKENGKFVFSILDTGLGAEDGMYFTINPDTGLLKSDTVFDRENQSIYKFRVKVADPTVTNYFDIANITVTILDDNDHPPVLVAPPPTNRTFHCPFNMTVGAIISTFTATDEDDPKLVELSYQIQLAKGSRVNRSPLFSMDSATGKLRIARMITPDDVYTHKLDVVIRDGPGVTSQSVVVSISVVVEEGSEEAMRAFRSSASKTNMVIVIIIVASTIIVAFIIIAIICLIRRVDKKRHPQPPAGGQVDNKLYQAAQWVSNVSVTNDICPEEVRSTLEVPVEKKKKKEVSFSLDEEVVDSPDTSGSIGSVFSPAGNNMQRKDGLPFQVNTKQGDFIVMNGMTTPDYSQHLYDAKSSSTDAPDEHRFMEVNRQAEDRYSDASSGDTGTSDSGRGGSEDESHGHTNSSGDADVRKMKTATSLSPGLGLLHTNSLTRNSSNQSPRLPPAQQQQQQSSKETEEIPGSPTPLLSERQSSPHCYTRRSFDKLPTHGLGYPAATSARSSPCPSFSQSLLFSTQPRSSSSSTRLTLSHNDVEGPFRVKKQEQQQQLLQTFSSPYSSGVPHSSTHPAWRRAKGLDTSWRSNMSSCHDDDDNTTTSGSYTISPDDLKEEAYNPDVMV